MDVDVIQSANDQVRFLPSEINFDAWGVEDAPKSNACEKNVSLVHQRKRIARTLVLNNPRDEAVPVIITAAPTKRFRLKGLTSLVVRAKSSRKFSVEFWLPEPGTADYIYDLHQTLFIMHTPKGKQEIWVRAAKNVSVSSVGNESFAPSTDSIRSKLPPEPTRSLWNFVIDKEEKMRVKRENAKQEKERKEQARREKETKASNCEPAKFTSSEPVAQVPFIRGFSVSTMNDAAFIVQRMRARRSKENHQVPITLKAFEDMVSSSARDEELRQLLQPRQSGAKPTVHRNKRTIVNPDDTDNSAMLVHSHSQMHSGPLDDAEFYASIIAKNK